MIGLVNWFTKITGWLPQLFCFRTKVYYEDRSVQSRRIKGPAVIISNHTSIYDYAVFLFVFWTRTLRYQMAEVLFKKPVLKHLLRGLGGIRVDRDVFDFSFVGESLEILKKGGVVGIFPESRLHLPGEECPLPFKTSAAYIAKESGVPIIPVYTNGSYFKWKRARVIIGKPVMVADMWNDKLDDRENLEAVSKKLRQKVISLGREMEHRQEDAFYRNYFWHNFIRITGAPVMLLFYRPRRIYASEAAKKHVKGGVLIVSNHIGPTDPILVQLAVWYRRQHFIAMKELFDRPIMGRLLRMCRCICVDRDNFNMSTFRQVVQILKTGRAVSLFPEGAINHTEQTVNSFKNGATMMALQSGCPVLSVYIVKRRSIWHRQICVIGEALDLRAMYGPMPGMKQIEEAGEELHRREVELMRLAQQSDPHYLPDEQEKGQEEKEL